MDQDQTNITDMFDTVALYFDKNSGVWSVMKAFADGVTEFKGVVAEIDADKEKQDKPTTGIAADKGDARTPLEDKLFEIADQLAALAEATGDNDLGAQAAATRSALDKLTGDDLITFAKRVSGLATQNLAALADYLITAADVTELDEARQTFEPLKNAPRVAVGDRSVATKSLPVKITKARSILRNRLDKMATKFRKTNPDFVAGYLAARVIVNRGGSGGATPPTPTPPATPPK